MKHEVTGVACIQDADALAGLDEFETRSVLAVAAITGACAKANDINGCQGVVDALLRYPDGRCAALEVTSVGSTQGREVLGLLNKCHGRWPIPGKYSWLVLIGGKTRLGDLKKRYKDIILGLEDDGFDSTILLDPSRLPAIQNSLEWAATARVTFIKIGSRPVWNTGVFLEVRESGGVVDSQLSGLAGAIEDLLADDIVHKHIEKLRRSVYQETHLFVGVFAGGLPFAQEFSIAAWDMEHTVADLPACEPPELPSGLTRLWILIGMSSFLLEISNGKWRWHPYDSVLGRAIL